MKKYLLLFLVIFTSLALCGCKSNEELLKEGTEEKKSEITSIISESAINEYIEGDIQFDQYDTIIDDEKTVFMYNILLPIKLSYLELDSSKQYELLRESAQGIFDFQGNDNRINTPKGMAIIDEDGERIKFQSLILYFGSNKNNTYKISLDNEYERTFNVSTDGKIDNIIFATISNEDYVIFSGGNILREGEYEKQGEWAFKKSDSNSDGESTGNTTTSKNNWESLTENEKYSMISTYIQQIENEGYTILVSEDYFVDALDAYYEGGYTNDTSIKEAILMVGLAGGGISR
ncbi:hypothetical protein [Bacillus dakarensis]|uniref:hypothetical protein n=2 Tax=Robertmurraya dakarensis TaxID=1926278 RepID=UPI0009811A6E|nr:hypothetical protein [Bacillus dakarensis]